MEPDEENLPDMPVDLPGESQQSGHTPQYSKPPKRGYKKLAFVLVAIVVVIGLVYGAYKLFGGKKSNTNSSTQQSSQQAQSQPAVSDVPSASGTKDYSNDNLNLKLSYPSNWTVTESDTKDSFRLESPEFTYQTTDKGNVTGNFRIYVRKGARDIDSKYIARGVAIQPSDKLTYTNPASTQRKDTYLSLFGLDTTDNFAFFLIAGNFNLQKGQSLGPTYGKELQTFIIAGGFSSKSLQDDLATNKVPVSTVQTSNAYKEAVEVLKSLQLQ